MAKLTIAESLDVAIKESARNADTGLSARQIAEQFYEEEREIVAEFAREWIIEKIQSLIRKRRARALSKDNSQYRLGFTLQTVLANGARLPLAEATIGQLRDYRLTISKRKPRMLAQVDKAITLMAKYASRQPGIKFSEVVQRELKGER